jgi:hypothetical protein
MENSAILAPAALLIFWSVLVLLYMAFTRFSTFAKVGIDLSKADPGARYIDIEINMPPKINWVSHNYTHLMEQPTLFYAVIAVLAIAGDSSMLSLYLAWAYVLLRIVHSIWQIFVNIVNIRALIFSLSSLCLLGLAINAVRATLF